LLKVLGPKFEQIGQVKAFAQILGDQQHGAIAAAGITPDQRPARVLGD
jgi:hypothetical protein